MSYSQYNECMEHNLQWFDTDKIECPVCSLENELNELRKKVTAIINAKNPADIQTATQKMHKYLKQNLESKE